MSGNVGKCREDVGNCREMSGNVLGNVSNDCGVGPNHAMVE